MVTDHPLPNSSSSSSTLSGHPSSLFPSLTSDVLSFPLSIGLVLHLILEFAACLASPPTSLIPHPSVLLVSPLLLPPPYSSPRPFFIYKKGRRQSLSLVSFSFSLSYTMGNVVSLVQFQHSTPAPDEPPSPPVSPRPSAAPSHIVLIQPEALCAFAPTPHPSPSLCDNPFDSPTSSPPLPFYTAPSTPLTSPQQEDPPQDAPSASIQQVAAAVAPPSPPPINPHLQPSLPSLPPYIEMIPPADALVASDLALDFTLDDEGLSTLEKIYLFSRSRSAHHRYA